MKSKYSFPDSELSISTSSWFVEPASVDYEDFSTRRSLYSLSVLILFYSPLSARISNHHQLASAWYLPELCPNCALFLTRALIFQTQDYSPYCTLSSFTKSNTISYEKSISAHQHSHKPSCAPPPHSAKVPKFGVEIRSVPDDALSSFSSSP